MAPICRCRNIRARRRPASICSPPSPTDVIIAPGKRALIPTGIAIALPPGTEAQVRPRSGLAARHGVTVLNTPGTIDADYRGEIQVILINLGDAALCGAARGAHRATGDRAGAARGAVGKRKTWPTPSAAAAVSARPGPG